MIETKPTPRTKSKTEAARTRRRLAAALAEAQLALARHDALAMIEAIFARGETSLAELEALMAMLPPGTDAFRLAEDAAGCARHILRGGGGNVFATLTHVAGVLRASEAAGSPRTS